MMEKVKHPQHYGGAEDPYEAIKVIHAWGLGFDLGSALKYIRRAGRKPGESERDDLEKALFYIQDHLDRLPKPECKAPIARSLCAQCGSEYIYGTVHSCPLTPKCIRCGAYGHQCRCGHNS